MVETKKFSLLEPSIYSIPSATQKARHPAKRNHEADSGVEIKGNSGCSEESAYSSCCESKATASRQAKPLGSIPSFLQADNSKKPFLAIFLKDAPMRMQLGRTAAVIGLLFSMETCLSAQEKLSPPLLTIQAPSTQHLTLDEAKHRVLANSKALELAELQTQEKFYARKGMQSYYLPKVIGSYTYLHFDQPLGQILTTKGIVLPQTIPINVIRQDLGIGAVVAAQPLTGLLKVRQGVKAALADEASAQAQRDKAIRLLTSGTTQLYWGVLAATRIQSGAQAAVAGGEKMVAAVGSLEAKAALLEARQALQAVDAQVADLTEQLNGLLDLPLCTRLELEDMPTVPCPITCCDEAVEAALASSPEVQEALAGVAKAQAGLAAKKLDYIPDVNVMGGYVNQVGIPAIQDNIGFVGVFANFTIFDGGKRRYAVRELQTLGAMAYAKLRMTEDEVRQKTVKAFREVDQTRQVLQTAEEMAQVRRQQVKKAAAPTAMLEAAKNQMKAEVELVQADLGYRMAIGQLKSITGKD
jgi:outer membrane protein TolC